MVRWGVISTAKIGRDHVIPAILKAKGASLYAIASRDSQRAQSIANTFGALQNFGSYDELLNSENVDAVYIPLPNSEHVFWSERAARKGKHVLCEKPIALKTEDIEDLIQVEIDTGVFISEAFMITYHPQWAKVRELLSSNKIGALKRIQAAFTKFNNSPSSLRNQLELGGGALPDIGGYPLVASRFATNSEPMLVSAEVKYDQGFKTDVYASAQIKFKDFELSFYCSTQMSLHQNMIFHGEKGRIEVHTPFNPPIDGTSVISMHSQNNTLTDQYEFAKIDQYKLQIEQFSSAIKNNSRKKIFNLSNSKNNQKVIDAIYKSALKGCAIKL